MSSKKRKSKGALDNDIALRAYCDEARRVTGDEFKHLGQGAHNLRRALNKYGRMRAWIVSGHLMLAAHANKAASGHAIATYLAFLKHFEPELAEARRRANSSHKSKQSQDAGFGFGTAPASAAGGNPGKSQTNTETKTDTKAGA
jgi:hypothetical protein